MYFTPLTQQVNNTTRLKSTETIPNNSQNTNKTGSQSMEMENIYEDHELYAPIPALKATGRYKQSKNAIQYIYRIASATLRECFLFSTHIEEASLHGVSIATIKRWEATYKDYGLVDYEFNGRGLVKRITEKGLAVIDILRGGKPLETKLTKKSSSGMLISNAENTSKKLMSYLVSYQDSPIPYTDTEDNKKNNRSIRKPVHVDNSTSLAANSVEVGKLCDDFKINERDKRSFNVWLKRNQVTLSIFAFALTQFESYKKSNSVDKPIGLLISIIKNELHTQRMIEPTDEKLIDISIEKAAQLLRRLDLDPTIYECEQAQETILEALQIQKYN